MVCIPHISDILPMSRRNIIQKEILNGRALEVLLVLLKGAKTAKEIVKELQIPTFTAQIYIKRLLEGRLIRITRVKVVGGKVEKTYELEKETVKNIRAYKESLHKIKEYFIEEKIKQFQNELYEVIQVYKMLEKLDLEEPNERIDYRFINNSLAEVVAFSLEEK